MPQSWVQELKSDPSFKAHTLTAWTMEMLNRCRLEKMSKSIPLAKDLTWVLKQETITDMERTFIMYFQCSLLHE